MGWSDFGFGNIKMLSEIKSLIRNSSDYEKVEERTIKSLRHSLKGMIELYELSDKGLVGARCINKLHSRGRIQYFRRKLTELNWSGVIPDF